MHQDALEPGQYPGDVHCLPAPPGVNGERYVLLRRRGADPGRRATDPEPGLVRVQDTGGCEGLADGVHGAAEPPGDSRDHPCDRAGRDRDAEQPGDRLAGAVPGQELAVPQVNGGRGQPRPVRHRGGHPAGAVPLVIVPHEQRREMIRCSVTLARISSGRSVTWRRSVLVTSAPNSPASQPEHCHASWVSTLSGRSVISCVVPGWPLGLPGLRPPFFRSDFAAGLPSPSADGGLEEFRGFCRGRACNASTSARSSPSCA